MRTRVEMREVKDSSCAPLDPRSPGDDLGSWDLKALVHASETRGYCGEECQEDRSDQSSSYHIRAAIELREWFTGGERRSNSEEVRGEQPPRRGVEAEQPSSRGGNE